MTKSLSVRLMSTPTCAVGRSSGKAFAVLMLKEESGRIFEGVLFDAQSIDIVRYLPAQTKLSVVVREDDSGRYIVKAVSLTDKAAFVYPSSTREERIEYAARRRKEGFVKVVIDKESRWIPENDSIETPKGQECKIEYLMDTLTARYITDKMKERLSLVNIVVKKTNTDGQNFRKQYLCLIDELLVEALING